MEHQIQLGEATYNIRLKLGVFDHIQQLTGQDGISFVTKSGENISFGMFVLLYAGMSCYIDKHGGQPVDKESLRKAVNSEAGIGDFTHIVDLYSKFMGAGEPTAQETESHSPGPNVKNSPTEL